MLCIIASPKQNIIPIIPLTCTPINIAAKVTSGLSPILTDTNLGSIICLSNESNINTTPIDIAEIYFSTIQ